MKPSIILASGIGLLLATAPCHAGWLSVGAPERSFASLSLSVKDTHRNKHEKKQAKKERKRDKEDAKGGGNQPGSGTAPIEPVQTGPVTGPVTGPANDNILWGDYHYTNPPKQ